MKSLILLAGAAALGIAAPAAAKPGHGHGHDRDNYSYNGRNCPPGLAKAAAIAGGAIMAAITRTTGSLTTSGSATT